MIDWQTWDEQERFNALLRDRPQTEEEIQAFLRDMSIHLMSEVHELLGTSSWKKHRRLRRLPNREHRLEEVVDIFKMWLTVAQGLGFRPDELRDAFMRKSAVVQQRHSEEWVHKLSRPSWVLDIDNVICDYISGLCQWMEHNFPDSDLATKARMASHSRSWVDADTLGISEADWQAYKHEFRVTGGKRRLPTMPGAKTFVDELRSAGYQIILLTSRPIDRYPNILTDTVDWLKFREIPYDHIWWATEKGERLLEADVLAHVAGIVDDDARYIRQYAKFGIPIYWYTNPHDTTPGIRPEWTHVRRVSALSEIPIHPITEV